MSDVRLAVLGSPIAHSKSPAIHRAAYAQLGLDWRYDAVDVAAQRLPDFIESCGRQWRGLSLTMPLKRDILPLLHRRDPLVDVVGGANTALFTDDGLAGFNTDVYGITRSLRDAGIGQLDEVLILGAGATAASALVACAQLGATRATVLARTPARASELVGLGSRVGVAVTARRLKTQEIHADTPQLVLSTLPAGADLLRFQRSTRERAALLDVAYDPWPSPLAQAWSAVGGTVISGLDMLIHQAVAQVRVFVHANPATPLPDEPAVLAAMRAAV